METTKGRLEPRRSGYADVNGLHMYYELYGEGSPLILLHGGMLTIDLNFATLIPALAREHQLIGVEMQGHGRTADIDRAITPAALASDVVALLDQLGIDRAHVFGHSMGGAVTLELGVSHPGRVRSLVPASTSERPDGLHEDLTDPARARRPRLHNCRARRPDTAADPRLAARRTARHHAHTGDQARRPAPADAGPVPGLRSAEHCGIRAVAPGPHAAVPQTFADYTTHVPGDDYIASVAAILSRGQPDTADPRESELGDQRADIGDEV